MKYNLSKEQVNKYNKDGYIIIENVIDQNFLNELNHATDRMLKAAKLVNKYNDQFDLAPNHSSENPSVRRIKQPQKYDEVFKKLLFYPKYYTKSYISFR